jgi:hypothetical protein
LLTRYLAKQIEAPALIDDLLQLLDGPEQREANRLARERLISPPARARFFAQHLSPTRAGLFSGYEWGEQGPPAGVLDVVCLLNPQARPSNRRISYPASASAHPTRGLLLAEEGRQAPPCYCACSALTTHLPGCVTTYPCFSRSLICATVALTG